MDHLRHLKADISCCCPGQQLQSLLLQACLHAAGCQACPVVCMSIMPLASRRARQAGASVVCWLAFSHLGPHWGCTLVLLSQRQAMTYRLICAGAILVLGRDLVMVPKLIHPLPPNGPGTPKSPAYGEPIEEEPPTPHPMTDTWMQVSTPAARGVLPCCNSWVKHASVSSAVMVVR